MIDELLANPWWLWLTFGGLLLAAEMLGTLLVWLVPMPWEWQGLSFAVLTILAALWWYRWLKHRDRTHPPSTLNQRGQQMIGRQLTLDEGLVNGFGHVRIGDGNWRVQAEEDLPAGTQITVVAVEGITLRIVRREV